jgi:hypothetical protein
MPSEPELEEIIESALLKGATRGLIDLELNRRAITNGQPAPSAAEINEAYAHIVERWVTDAGQDEDKSFAYHVRLRKHLYQKSFGLNDFKTCLAIAADLAGIEERHRLHHEKLERAKRLGAMMGGGA